MKLTDSASNTIIEANLMMLNRNQDVTEVLFSRDLSLKRMGAD